MCVGCGNSPLERMMLVENLIRQRENLIWHRAVRPLSE
jgi:hypothetical protein